MTFREKLARDHPEDVSDRFVGGCYGCPTHYGYEKTRSEGLCHGKSGNETICRKCWDREIPMTPEEQEQHDLEINAEIIQGYCDQYTGKPCCECPAKIVCDQVYADGTSWHCWPEQIASPTKQRAMLDSFEAALPTEDDAPAEAARQELPQAVRKLVEGRIKELTERVKALEAERDALCDLLNGVKDYGT